MNQITIAQYNSTAVFYPIASSTYLIIGTILKPANAAIMVRMDYSQIGITNITGWSFNVDVGSNPSLAVSSPSAGATLGGTSPWYLDFIISGGVEGQRYNLTVAVEGSGNRSDTIGINVPLSDCGCGAASTGGNSALYPAGTNQVYINSAPKYIVSNVTPLGANLMDQWYNPSTNELAEYITDGTNYWWQTTITTAPPAPTTFATVRLNPIPVDGGTTQFSLTSNSGVLVDILASTDLMVSVDGVWQEPVAQFITFSNQIQFATAPSANSAVFMIWFQH